VHHGDDQDSLRTFEEDDGGELLGQSSAEGRIDLAKASGLYADLPDDALDLAETLGAKAIIDLGVIADGFGKLRVRLRMDALGHRPASLRARASASSKGIG